MKSLLHLLKTPSLVLLLCLSGIQNLFADTAYAVLNNNELTFYYDDKMDSHTGIIFNIDDSNLPGWRGLDQSDWQTRIETVIFQNSFSYFHPHQTMAWFEGLTHLTTIVGIKNLNTDQTVSMSRMFQNCQMLESIDLSHFNTSKVIAMAYMFNGCEKLKTLDLSSFSTPVLSNTLSMFESCYNLESIKFGTKFWTENVTNMERMFSACHKLTYLDLSYFDTSSVENMKEMFSGCINLETIEVSELWTMEKVESSTWMFNMCSKLTGGAGTSYETQNTRDGTCAHIDGGPENPGYFTKFEGYNLWLGDIRVTKLNKDYISLVTGFAEYDPDENKLFLKKCQD